MKKRAELNTRDGVLRSQDLAELAETTPRALRHYHKIGLLPEVPRDANGYRRYSARDLVRVLRIRQLSMSGMPLREIAGVLDHGGQGQADLLDELDRSLRRQAERITEQRRLLAELRASMVEPAWSDGTEQPTATRQLDDDVWTLATGTGVIDSESAAALEAVLRSDSLAAQVAAWYPEFEQLEGQSHIDDPAAERIAEQIAAFADAVVHASGFAPVDGESPIMEMVEHLQADSLSPAQQKVWGRFRSIIETRWAQSEDL